MYSPSCNYLLALFKTSMARFNQTELNDVNQRRRFGGPRWNRRISIFHRIGACRVKKLDFFPAIIIIIIKVMLYFLLALL